MEGIAMIPLAEIINNKLSSGQISISQAEQLLRIALSQKMEGKA
jgi:hypothetical protein